MLNRDLLSAFDRVAEAAVANRCRIIVAIHKDLIASALTSFDYEQEEIELRIFRDDLPGWLQDEILSVADDHDWPADWFRTAFVDIRSSPEHPYSSHRYGSFPRREEQSGLIVFASSPEQMLALKLKTLPLLNSAQRETETHDLRSLIQSLGLSTIDQAFKLMDTYFPHSQAHRSSRIHLL